MSTMRHHISPFNYHCNSMRNCRNRQEEVMGVAGLHQNPIAPSIRRGKEGDRRGNEKCIEVRWVGKWASVMWVVCRTNSRVISILYHSGTVNLTLQKQAVVFHFFQCTHQISVSKAAIGWSVWIGKFPRYRIVESFQSYLRCVDCSAEEKVHAKVHVLIPRKVS